MHLHARLTMYALLSEMEADFRRLIDVQLGSELSAAILLNPEAHAKMLERFKKEHPDQAPTLKELLAFADLGDIEQTLRTHKARLSPEAAEMLRVAGPRFQPLVPIRNRVMHSRPINFTDLPAVLQFTELLVKHFPSMFPDLVVATDLLKEDPSYVLQQTIPAPETDGTCANNLPFPDFDETGFIGRENELAALHKHVRGPYPVISILGEGGLGKTSLALKVAYEILDENRTKYDAIIWSSSKSAQLTPHGIREIDNSIRDSLGLLQHAAKSLGGVESDDPVAEIHNYMSEYRLLLILDNLETVLDARIRHFLEGIPEGTKIVLTSRIGLQAMDLPITLRPMGEASDLLRALSAARGVEELTKTNNKQLQVYCARLHNNPLAIKWFVSAVQHGLRPEEVLREQGILLDYCMSNVYKHLSDDSQLVLSVFQAVGKALGIAQLVAISALEAARARAALLQLDGTNMITMRSVPSGATYETTYSINHLALAFLNKHHLVSNAVRQHILKQQRRLVAMVEELSGSGVSDPFSIHSVSAKTETEMMVASLLKTALGAVRGRPTNEEFGHADSCLTQAKSIAPDYFEVHRVEGYIRYRAKRLSEAIVAYEAAIELAPKHPPLRLWFGQLLLREGNLSDAKTQLDEASRLMPNEPRIKIEAARLNLYQREFEAARGLLSGLMTMPEVGDIYLRQAQDLLIQSFVREAEEELRNRKPVLSLTRLEDAKVAYDTTPGHLMDIKIRETAARAQGTANRVETSLRESDLAGRAELVRRWCEDVGFQVSRSKVERAYRAQDDSLVTVTLEGTVRTVGKKNYAYIRVLSRQGVPDVFLHTSDLTQPSDAARIVDGIHVSFVLGQDQSGRPKATMVRILG